MKKVIVVSSTPRKGGNSEILAQRFADGAKEAGHEVKFVTVRDLDLKFCIGCMVCQKTHGNCVLGDGMNALYEEIQHADVLAFASPVYYYSVCGQLKTFLDRLNPLYVRENDFKEVYLLSTAAEDEEAAMDGSVTAVQGWCDCFVGVKIKGVLRGTGLEDKGEANSSPFPQKAYEMGKGV